MRSHFVAVPMSILQPVYSAVTSRSSRLKTHTNLHLRRLTSLVLPPPDPPDPPDPPNLPSSLNGSPRRSLTSISNPPSPNSSQIPSFPRSSSIISIPTGSCRAVHCCCSGECSVSALTCLASHSCCFGHVMVEAQVVPLEPPDPSPPDVSLLLQMQPLARALTFSAVCNFSDTSISSLPWPLLHFEANSVDEKPIVIFSPMNMIVASSDVPFVSYLEQSHFPIFPLIWSELDEQASLVLQGSSSHRMLFSASGAVCVVLWVTLDAIFREAYEAVFDTISYGSSCDLYRHSIYRFDTISYGLFFCLARSSFYVSSFDGV
ncbi:uncharacterized protein LOC111203307 [Brassica napus]|uniref:uncharacterized protein LOC111203307 n=1 Tax=Brassica napus TaxID=3708 RepID=UPI00207A35A1|nr:uncharacterized protein LOC111203307 [Brassica napus]